MALAEAQKLRRVLLRSFPGFCQIFVSTTSSERGPPTLVTGEAAEVDFISDTKHFLFIVYFIVTDERSNIFLLIPFNYYIFDENDIFVR